MKISKTVLVTLYLLIAFAGQSIAQKIYKLSYDYVDPSGFFCNSYLYVYGKEKLFVIKDGRNSGSHQNQKGMHYKLYNDKWARFFYENETVNITRVPIYNKELIYESGSLTEMVTLKNNKRKIGKFNCQEAEVRKGGVNYTVWFTKDLPVSANLYNLKKVPGTIIKISHEQYPDFEIKFQSIEEVKEIEEFKKYKDYILSKKPLNPAVYEKEATKLLTNAKIHNIAVLAKMKAKMDFSDDEQRYYTVHLVDIPKGTVAALKSIK